MQIDRRALYNSLRMNWLADPTLNVEPWQVEDYRSIDLDILFERLQEFGIALDRQTFQLFAENIDTPEDLTDEFLAENELDTRSEDQVYLIIFELWRRLATEKKSLSIFLDELDHQIYLYDHGHLKNQETIQDALEEFSLILEENMDSGIDPSSIFETISASSANDLESFLYDFILEQIDHENYSYASELLDDFIDYVPGEKWFQFLKAQIQAVNDTPLANQTIRKLLQENAKIDDLEFNLEVLSFVAKAGEYDIFLNLLKKSLPLIETEEDFIDLAYLSMEYFERLDLDARKQAIQKIVDSRSKIPPQSKFRKNEPQVAEFVRICENN